MMQATIPDKARFQKKLGGKNVELVVLKNSNGTQAAITNYGARWVSALVPDKTGTLTDVVAGFDSIAGYLDATEFYYGATVGRCANRIKNAAFYLEEKYYQLSANRGSSHLHGGIKGFQAVVWAFEKVTADAATLFYLAKDGEEGYPGNLSVRVTYTLTDMDALKIDFWAQTDKTTIINLTNHAFFNLNGQGSGSILNHSLFINADHYTPMDAESLPLGDVVPVAGTPFDFRQATTIGARINADTVQLKNGNGYDHNFVLNKTGEDMTLAAIAIGDASGIKMEVYTTEPGMQLYTGNFMDGSNILKGGARDDRRTAFCLETQHFPDAPHHDNFPSIILHRGDTYKTTTLYRFSVAG